MKYRIFFILALCSFAAFSQSNYHQGYIITNNSDTLKGFINVKEWNLNPKSIQFKLSKSVEPKEYLASEILLFEVPEFCLYRTYKGPLSLNDNSKSNSKIDSTFRQDTVFLKSLIEAPYVSLLVYNDRLKQRFFIRDKENRISEMHSYTYMEEGFLQSHDPYKKQLRELLTGYGIYNEASSNAIRNSAYNEPYLKKMIWKINSIEKSDKKRSAKINSNSWHPFISLSGNISKMSFNGDHFLAGDGNTITNYIEPTFSLGFIVYPNPNTKKIAFRFPFSIYKLKFETEIEKEVTPERFRYGKYNFKALVASVAPTIQYNVYNNRNFKFYVNSGVALSFPVNSYSKYSNYISKSFIQNELNQPPDEIKLEPDGFWLEIPVEAGFQVKGIQLFAIYQQPIVRRIYMVNEYNIQLYTYGLGFRYLFGKL